MDLKTHIKETVKLAVPISLGQFGHILMGIVDSIMVGKVGYAPLAAASLVNGLFFLVLVIGIGLSFAATPLIAIAKGENKDEECGKILNHSIVANLLFSVIIFILIFLLSFLIPNLNQPKEVVELAIPYLQILSLSIFPFIIFQSYRQFLEGLSLPNPPMVIALSANILNAFLNWIFIYGNFGFEAMGLFGAGIATTITRYIMAASLMIYTINYQKVNSYSPQLKFKPLDLKLIKKIYRIGLPSGFQYFFEVACFSFATIMVGWIGSKQQAAHQIALNLASATYMVMLGISAAGTIRVGGAFGRKEQKEIRLAGFTALGMSSLLMLFFAIVMILLRDILPTFYNNDPEVISYASTLLIIAGMFQIFDGLQATGVGILRGLTDVKIPLYVSLLSYWVIAIPIAYILGFIFDYGVYGIWFGLLLGLASVGITLFIRFNKKSLLSINN